jgi:hypothetical protein
MDTREKIKLLDEAPPEYRQMIEDAWDDGYKVASKKAPMLNLRGRMPSISLPRPDLRGRKKRVQFFIKAITILPSLSVIAYFWEISLSIVMVTGFIMLCGLGIILGLAALLFFIGLILWGFGVDSADIPYYYFFENTFGG